MYSRTYMHVHCMHVRIWLQTTLYSRTLIIRPLHYPEPRLSGLALFFLENGRVPQMRMRVAAVTMETCLLIFCACADNHVALLFINKVGG